MKTDSQISKYHYVERYKLTKIYFLKRQFSEGVTIVNVKDCHSHLGKEQLKRMFIWHLKAIF